MFVGQMTRTLDEKRRLTIPRDVARKCGEEIFFLVADRGKYAKAYSVEEVKKFPKNKMRLFYSASIDKQGRTVVPYHIVDKVFMGCKEVIWEGWGKYCKIIPVR